MFDFIRKKSLFEAWDKGIQKAYTSESAFHLKTAQDVAVYSPLRGMSGKTIAEIGGGDSRLLPALAKTNNCVNVEKFQGADGGPGAEKVIPGVKNVKCFLGEFSPDLADNSFDVVFSVSVVEHVPDHSLGAFLDDGLRILKPGGMWLHAIDLYLEDKPSEYWSSRFTKYRDWMDDPRIEPLGNVYRGPLKFSTAMVTNPDNTMYQWNKISPTLIDLRNSAQSVSLLLVGTAR